MPARRGPVAKAHAVVDPRRDLDLERLLPLDAAPCAAAVGARVGDDAAAAVTFRASLLDREEALLHAHLACAAAGGAGLGLGAGLCAAAVAGLAIVQGGMRIVFSAPRAASPGTSSRL